jgi:hypothetical protein
MADEATSCVETAAGPIAPEAERAAAQSPAKEVHMPIVRVGQVAPDFELNAHIDGGFSCASTPVTSPSFDRPSCRQLPSNTES